MFKVMHWPNGKEILAISLTVIMITYTLRFVAKAVKTKLDLLKLLWVITTASSNFIIMNHWMGRDILILSNLLGWFIVLFYFAEEFKKEVKN